ncbi:MAG TPA: NUDIX domain-containing protein [Candidatus Saccharimonadales bacterium]
MTNDVIKKVSAGGVLYHQGKFLVIKWLSEDTVELPKGTIETNETAEEACVREMFEETGYNVAITDNLGQNTFAFKWKDGKNYEKTVHYFLMKRVDELEPTPNREENEDFENLWLSYDEAIAQLTHDDMRGAVMKANDIITKRS